MADGLNKVFLAGNLAADPEFRQTQGDPVLNLRLATTESYLNKDKVRQERTEFHSLTVWGRRAEALSKILRKGSAITVEGSLQTRSYEKDGEKRYATSVRVINLVLGGSGRSQSDGEPAREERPARGKAPATPPPDDFDQGGGFGDDDIPF